MSEVLEFLCPDRNTRLDIYIASLGMELSRSRVQKLIKDGHILVPDRPGAGIEWNEEAVSQFLMEA